MARQTNLMTVPAALGMTAFALLLVGCDIAQLADKTPDPSSGTTAGILEIKAVTDTLGAAAFRAPSPQLAPDDVDVNLTPSEYAIAFKRIVVKQVDEETDETLAEVEVFSAETVDDALVVDLTNSAASDVLSAEALPAGTYNKVDIEVFYLDMTVATIYPGSESHDIPYRMVFEEMDSLEPRDFLLYLDPSWMEAGSDLADLVTEEGWYWMEMSDPDNVVAVEGAAGHPEFHVLDLFANEEFWSSEHKVLEGGMISPPLEYDPEEGGVLTIRFDVTGKFNFKDYHDESEDPDGLWEIRKDAGIHPFPPDFNCLPQLLVTSP
ncbi:MAG: hypothetical protein JXQ75_23695 [Phycisphaerae bacterium]|nr:hypothetical protein [Phycisphaerae bacterium]